MNNRAVVFLLKCVFLYSENPLSRETARKILLAYSTTVGDSMEMQRGRDGYYGSFMRAICQGDLFGAYQIGDTANREALAMGMQRYLDQSSNVQTNLYDDGIEPSDYLPETEEANKEKNE